MANPERLGCGLLQASRRGCVGGQVAGQAVGTAGPARGKKVKSSSRGWTAHSGVRDKGGRKKHRVSYKGIARGIAGSKHLRKMPKAPNRRRWTPTRSRTQGPGNENKIMWVEWRRGGLHLSPLLGPGVLVSINVTSQKKTLRRHPVRVSFAVRTVRVCSRRPCC